MVYYIIKRIMIMFPILIIVLIITFILSRFMDIFPVIRSVGFNLDPNELRRLIELEEQRMGYDLPIFQQLGIYFMNFLMYTYLHHILLMNCSRETEEFCGIISILIC